jgi:2-polyprenyl-3-methyl-5-hydroxy-6-metoxy-1,4-benzoquinol methylase
LGRVAVSETEKRLGEFYDLRAREEPKNDQEAEIRFRKALAAANVVSGDKILDIGSKWGGLGACARGMGLAIDYTGLDLSEEHVRRAAELGLEVRLTDVSQPLPLDDAEYSCVFCMELLEHLASPLALLQEVRRILKSDGRAIVSVPNPYYWVEVYREFFSCPDPEGHLASFPTPMMLNILALAGLRVEKRLGTYVRLPKTGWLVPTDSIFSRSRIYVVCPTKITSFAGR